jgi:hypothetical protein
MEFFSGNIFSNIGMEYSLRKVGLSIIEHLFSKQTLESQCESKVHLQP